RRAICLASCWTATACPMLRRPPPNGSRYGPRSSGVRSRLRCFSPPVAFRPARVAGAEVAFPAHGQIILTVAAEGPAIEGRPSRWLDSRPRRRAKEAGVSEGHDDLDRGALNGEALVAELHDDHCGGPKKEVCEGVNILLG